MVQAALPVTPVERSPFAVLMRHLFERLLHSDSLGLGEESASRVIALAYAVALPGMLYALYLYPEYHSPLGKPPFWAQSTDHLFYMTYEFTVMGLATVLQWDLLFPDLMDSLVLGSLPIARRQLLLARLEALSLFFGGILLGTSLLGIVFLPLISELPGVALRQLGAHAAAVLLSGACAAFALVAVQGILIGTLGQAAALRISPLLQAACVLLLLTMLFLFPLLAHGLPQLLMLHFSLARWFPPFWFLGVYEVLLHPVAAPALFSTLALTGVVTTAIAASLALLTYPLAYARRVRQTVEGIGLHPGSGYTNRLAGFLHRLLLRDPCSRAIAGFIGQTLWRTQTVRLTLAVFGGLAFATTAAAVLTLHADRTVRLVLSASAVNVALPIAAFWSVGALRAALRIPVAPAAAWLFRAIHGRAKGPHLLGVATWVAARAAAFTLAVTGVVLAAIQGLTPHPAHLGASEIAALLLMAIAIPVLLTQVFFLAEVNISFTEAPAHSVNELSWLVLTWFAAFPLFCYAIATLLSWAETSLLHLLLTAAVVLAIHFALSDTKKRVAAHYLKRLDLGDDTTLLPGEMGLRR